MFLLTVISLSVATVSIALVAGYVLAYANSVMPGLRNADDRVFVQANQRLNAAVHNPVFMTLANVGPVALLAGIVLLALTGRDLLALIPTIASLALYGVTLAVTMGINVPMNNRLIGLGDITAVDQARQARVKFEKRWTSMNTIRTWTTTASAVTALTALLIVATH